MEVATRGCCPEFGTFAEICVGGVKCTGGTGLQTFCGVWGAFCAEAPCKGRVAGTALWGSTGEGRVGTSGGILLGTLGCKRGDALAVDTSLEEQTFLLAEVTMSGAVRKLGCGL